MLSQEEMCGVSANCGVTKEPSTTGFSTCGCPASLKELLSGLPC